MNLHDHSYVPSGVLPKPGLLGRGIRLILGIFVLMGATGIIAGFRQLVSLKQVPGNVELWLFALLLFASMREVIDLGLGMQWGQKAQIATLILAGICIVLDEIIYGRLWAPPFGLLFCIWCLLIAIPLGVALILAAILGTPGCEMRSYADLLARLQGHSAAEHYCPGGIDFIDRWGAHSGKK
jgi:hypothetical protein